MKKVYFDSQRCLGCHSCEFSCAVEHSKSKNPRAAHLEEEAPVPRRNVALVAGVCLTVACRHCEPALCMEACIAGAMTREKGEVQCHPTQCIGCWMCVMVCPFDAVRPGKIYSIKCDMCPDKKGSYACVEACPTRALFVMTPEEFKSRPRENKRMTKAGILP